MASATYMLRKSFVLVFIRLRVMARPMAWGTYMLRSSFVSVFVRLRVMARKNPFRFEMMHRTPGNPTTVNRVQQPAAELKIAIIGGGPAGSFTCHFLNKFAKENNKTISIHLYDYKCFSCQGRSSCNMCAGIIASTLVENLGKEKIFLPDSVIKSEISGYHLHSKYNTVYFKRDHQKKIYSVFRGKAP